MLKKCLLFSLIVICYSGALFAMQEQEQDRVVVILHDSKIEELRQDLENYHPFSVQNSPDLSLKSNKSGKIVPRPSVSFDVPESSFSPVIPIGRVAQKGRDIKTLLPRSTSQSPSRSMSRIDSRSKIRKSSLKNALLAAVEQGDNNNVKQLLKQKADIHVVDEKGRTALHLAAVYNRSKIARRLIDNGASHSAVDNLGRTPLHAAVNSNHLEIVKLLLEALADVDSQDHDGCTPLHLSTKHGFIKITELLVQHRPKIDIRDRSGKTPIDYAKEYAAIVNLLEQEKKKQNNSKCEIL